MATGPSARRTAAAALLAACAAPGCHKPDPPPAEPPPAAVAVKVVRCPIEVRLWLIWHGFGPDDALADLCDRLDRLTDDELRTFDRQSPSHIGYRDIRADLRGIVADHGAAVTVRDLHLVREECIGHWQVPGSPAAIP